MKQLAPTVFQVGSETSDRTYIVDMSGDHPTCTCTAWAIARNRAHSAGKPPPGCKHVRQVEETGAVHAVADLKALLAEMTEGK